MKKKLLLLFSAFISITTIMAQQLTESFDGVTFPPAGWTTVHTSAGVPADDDPAAVWEREVAGALGGDVAASGDLIVDPRSGAGMASFKSYDYAAGNGALLVSPAVNLTAGGPHVVRFWMYRDNGYVDQDSVSVYVNTTASKTGASFLGKVIRNVTLAPVEANGEGWYQYSFAIPAGFNTATNYIIFSAVGQFGNNIFMDDVRVTPAVITCGAPVLESVTGFNSAAGTATLSWSAPDVGTPAGYQWSLNSTGVVPASGTSITSTSVNLTGITPNAVNYFYLRSDCGGGSFSTWVTYSFASLSCPAIITPAPGGVNVPQSEAFEWTPVPGATEYQFFLGATPGTETYLGSTADTVASLYISPNTAYSWVIIPSIDGIASPPVCSSSTFTTGAEPNIPVNNTCSGATSITAANTAANPITSTTRDATLTEFADVCNNFTGTADDDVWFEFTTSATAPALGTLTIAPTATADSIADIVAFVYQGTDCTNLGAPVACADGTEYGAEVINLAGLTPNTHYFMRVFSFFGDPADRGDFTITASVNSTLPVRLTSFTARRVNAVNQLEWNTQQEVNTAHFSIERSTDGRNFASIGRVMAAGNTNTERNYSYTDIHPVRGNNYYRLRTVDKDNVSKLSDTRRIRNEGIADVNIYPNPVTDKISVSINADKASNGQLMITDVSGKVVYSRNVKLPQGSTILPVPVSNIAAGSYILKLQLDDDVIVKKFNKQ